MIQNKLDKIKFMIQNNKIKTYEVYKFIKYIR
jgi:hypothetical protein